MITNKTTIHQRPKDVNKLKSQYEFMKNCIYENEPYLKSLLDLQATLFEGD